ncbi:MAG: hypothetical protein CL811_05750 [Colwelliaceae bacterium]|nr:hypothetical protein [Colwelliaceae bacterium]|tara:strand:- start:597 stop:845 length:249 start_codon:yes stop_codon:yes gene_type:complete
MPLYAYACGKCQIIWEEMGTMGEDEEHECPECGLTTKERVPNWEGPDKIVRNKKVGDEVKAFIEDSRSIVEEYREELKRSRE